MIRAAGRPLSTFPLTVISGTIKHSADWKDYLEPAEKTTAKREQLSGSSQIDQQGGSSNTPQGGISALQIIFLFFINENNL
jgi:hypothetical protein